MIGYRARAYMKAESAACQLPRVPDMWALGGGEPHNPGAVPLSRMWFCGNADLVGAINVLAGHRVAACGDTSPARGASAQEPTEANLYETVHAAP